MYDANFGGWWAWVEDTLIGKAQQQLSLSSGKNVTLAQTYAYVQSQLATSICTTAQEYCVGPELQQYKDATSCYNFLTKETRMGEAFELGKSLLQPPPRQTHRTTVSSPTKIHYSEDFTPSHTYCNGLLPVKNTPQENTLPSHTHTTPDSSPSNTPIKKNLPPQTQTNNPPRPQHRRLPHGASKHGRPPPRGPLPAHRPFRRGILHRFPLLRCHRRTNILHELPVRLRQL